MADLGGIPLDCASDKDGFQAAKECFEVGDDEFCKKDEKVGSLSGLGQGKEEIRVVERGVEIGGALENDKEVGGESGDLIGASDGEVNGSDGSKSDEMIKLNGSSVISGGLDGTDIDDVVGLNKTGMNNRENASDEDMNVGGDLSAVNDVQINSGNGLKGGGLDDPGIVDAVVIEGNGMKHPQDVSDENQSEGDSESESESLSSSSSSSSSSCDEEDEPEEDYQDIGAIGDEKKSKIEKVAIEEEMAIEECEVMLSDADEMVAWSDDEDAEDGGSGMAGPTMSKNELKVLPPVPSVTVTLQPHHQTLPIGIILSIIGTQVIVEGIEKHNPLNEGSILWITDGRLPLGMVDEIFGPVKNPYYVVRYNSESEVPTGIQQGTSVSFVQEFANHVLNDKNLYQKGYDASGENDEELSDEFEFSDDEKEAEYKRMLKTKKRGKNELKSKRQFKKIRSWNCNQVLVANSPSGGNMMIQEDPRVDPSATASLNIENHMSSSGLGQGLAGNNAMVSVLAPRGQPPDFCPPNGICSSNGFPHQQHQIIGLSNELAANVMPWTLQNHPHQLYQMPLPNNMPFQQQMSAIPRLPGNFISLGGHSNLGRAPAFGPWPAAPHQNIYIQSQLGMDLQAPNAREHTVQSDGSFHLPTVPVSYGRPHNTNRSGGGGGRKVHHGGGGHSGGGRGRYRQH